MTAPALPPVPTPPRRRWRAFRTGALPVVIFLACVAAIAGLWNGSATVPAFVAEADAPRKEIGTVLPGRLSTLHVTLLQAVKGGDVLGEVSVASPEVVEASLAVLRAEIDLLHKSLAPAVDQQRVALDFFRLQLDWMRERVDLAVLQNRVRQAEADLRRATALHEKNLISEENFDAALNLHQRLAAQAGEQVALVERLAPMAQQSALPSVSLTETLAAGIRVQEEKLRLAEHQLRPVPLIAPFDGVVTGLLRQEGETVAAGSPIIIVTAPRPAQLVGFLRQPFSLQPRRAMPVEIRTRSAGRRIAPAAVTAVGYALEPVPPTILGLLNRTGAAELGLRVQVSAPPELELHPGEQVDVIFTAGAARP